MVQSQEHPGFLPMDSFKSSDLRIAWIERRLIPGASCSIRRTVLGSTPAALARRSIDQPLASRFLPNRRTRCLWSRPRVVAEELDDAWIEHWSDDRSAVFFPIL